MLPFCLLLPGRGLGEAFWASPPGCPLPEAYLSSLFDGVYGMLVGKVEIGLNSHLCLFIHSKFISWWMRGMGVGGRKRERDYSANLLILLSLKPRASPRAEQGGVAHVPRMCLGHTVTPDLRSQTVAAASKGLWGWVPEGITDIVHKSAWKG